MRPFAAAFASVFITGWLSGAELEPSENPVMMGKVHQFTDAHRIVLLRNTGSEPVEINKVQACCGCSSTLLSAPVIPVGGSADVLLTFNPECRHGSVEKHFTVFRRHGEPTGMRIHMKAEVPLHFKTTPSAPLYLGEIEPDSPERVQVDVSRLGRKSFRVAGLEYDRKLLDIRRGEPVTTKEGSTITFSIGAAETAPYGAFYTHVVGRREGNEGGEPFGFVVNGRVVGDIVVLPERLLISIMSPGRTKKKHVVLRSTNGMQFRITGVVSDNSHIKASYKTVHAQSHQVYVEVDTHGAKGNLEAEIVVSTDHAVNKTVKIPVLVLFRVPERSTEKTPSTPERELSPAVKSVIQKYRSLFGDLPDGFTGKRRATYPNGATMKEFSFRNGKLDGRVKSYAEGGRLLYVQEYRSGCEISFTKGVATEATE